MTTFLTIPCFNEAKRWDINYWRDVVTTPHVTCVFVDDGSDDETGRLAEKVCRGTPSHVLSQSKNQGKAEAVRCGMQWSLARAENSDAVGFMDADGAFRLADVERFIRLCEAKFDREGWDAIWSSRVALAGRFVSRSSRRHYLGRIAATFLFGSTSDVPYDTQSGLKFFRPSPDLQRMLSSPFQTRWLFEVELLHRYENHSKTPLRVWEEPLMYWSEVPGSKIRGKEAIRAAREILVMKRMLRNLSR